MAVTLPALRATLPRGRTLSTGAWAVRHRALLTLLWAHVVLLPVFGIGQGVPVAHALGEGAIVGAFAVAGSLLDERRRVLASAVVALGLLSSSAILVHFAEGLIEAHFHFFVMMVALTLYEEWLPFLLAAAYVGVHHGVLGVIAPEDVYNHTDAAEHPWRWALIHAGFIGAAGAFAVAAWRLNEDVRAVARRSEQRFRHSFENAPVGMALSDRHGRFLAVNESLSRITGYSAAELTGRNFADVIHADDLVAARDVLRAMVRGDQETFAGHFRYRHRDGHDIAVAIRAARQEDAGEVGFVVHFEDITEQQQGEHRARRHRRHQEIVVALGQHALSRVPLDALFDEAVELVAQGAGISERRQRALDRLRRREQQ